MSACRHHQRGIDGGSRDGFGDERIGALIERPSDSTGRLGGEQRDERDWLFGGRPRQEPVPPFVGVNKNDVDILDSGQRAPARLGAKSKQRALANETIGRVAGAMQDDRFLTKEARRRLHDTILSCGCALGGRRALRRRMR